MDFYKVPIGFGMALAMNQPAMNAYAAMTEAQKQILVESVTNAFANPYEMTQSQYTTAP